ncbi:putative choline transporter, neither null mutation nor overexpression affects choline transport [Podila epicladia]|nr:putative choline transporter, neither null mutation nor overexpression affects choline transport [Podila epicladia]KAG0089157.1 putative choline transporter, neither null mutation nor overexpression affects choline transport [Podila epicladia]
MHIVAYFSFYWLSQVLTNIVHVTISGVFATHYFKYVINEALEFITLLVYYEVTIYGKPFFPAAKDVFKIVKDHGLDQVLNDIIISTLWSISAFLALLLEVWIVTGLIFFLGMQVIFTAGAVIHSGVAAIFVALAEDLDALAKTKPKVFARIQALYPDIVQDVHH